METIRRLFKDPQTSFFLFGPRGTGKSTWLNMEFPDALYIDLLSPELYRQYSAKPERLKELVSGNPDKKIVIIDEVQKVPDLLDVVHQLIESKKDVRFVLTGSGARKLKRTGVDLLAGRALYKTFHPFIAAELKEKFNLNDGLKRGFLPLVCNSINPEEVLNSYAALYLNQEIQTEGLVRNIGNFARFLESISFSHGAVLNISGVARECQVGRKTVEGYIKILEDLLLCFFIPVFTKRAKRDLIAHQKFYFFDAGVYRSLRPAGPYDSPQEIDGGALEGVIAQHLLAWNSLGGNSHKIYYWRTKSGLEVDFIIYGKDSLYALEVKNTDIVRTKDLRGLRAFKEDYPDANAIFLYRGTEKLKIDKILCLPCDDFLKRLVPGVRMEY